MGCCGDRRAGVANAPKTDPRPTRPTSATTQQRRAPTPVGQRDRRMARVRYRRRSMIRLQGPSGHEYEFSADRDVQTVYRADLAHLLRTGFFETV